MAFNWNEFLAFAAAALFRSKGTHYRLTPKRIGVIVVFSIVYPLVELCNWIGFLLDDVFFRGYRRQEVRQPVFIVGNPRSGTTFLHRLLAKDSARFLSMLTWEIFFAPSIVQRKMWRALGALDRRIGRPLQRLLRALQRLWQEELVAHEFALWAPEEDEYLLLHIWSTLVTCTFTGVMDRAHVYTYFDTAMPRAHRNRIMAFYKRGLQRHLYAHRGNVHPGTMYLAKNPLASPKVDALYEWFPDARFIYLVRNPVDMIPSYISVMDQQLRSVEDPLCDWSARDYALDMARHWYTYPLARLAQAPKESYVIVRYDDLVGDPEGAVTQIYRQLGIEMDPAFAEVLHAEAVRSRRFQSRHRYSLEPMGLSCEQITAAYGDILAQFDFEPVSQPSPPWHQKRRRVRWWRRRLRLPIHFHLRFRLPLRFRFRRPRARRVGPAPRLGALARRRARAAPRLRTLPQQ